MQQTRLAELEIVVDSHEQYAYRFAGKPVTTVRRTLPAGDYAVTPGGRLVAVVERKSLPDLVTSLTTGKLKYALGELAALPRAAVVVEDRYSQRSSSTTSGPPWWPTAWPSCRSACPPWRSCSARVGRWPRSGPTATWPRPRRGRLPSPTPSPASPIFPS